MLPCVVTDFFLNNQPDAPIIHIYSVIKLCMFRASSVPIVIGVLFRTFITGKFRAGFLMSVSKQSQDVFHPDSAWKRSSETCMKLTRAECAIENS